MDDVTGIESKHTREPWRTWRDHSITTATRDGLEAGSQYVACALNKADAERIVACVNACAGIKNPAAVPDMYEAIRWAMEILLDSWGYAQIVEGDDQAYNVLEKALAKADGR